MVSAFLCLGLWRCWLGGGIGKDWPIKRGLTWLQYAVLAVIVGAARWGEYWAYPVMEWVCILILARGLGHGPMLQNPLGPDKDDWILAIVGGPGGGTFKWLCYAVIRYVGLAIPWALVAGSWWVLFGAGLIVLAYYVNIKISARLPTMTTPGDEAGNWSELIGWTACGMIVAAGFV